ncbi:MAG: hypothetical protein N3A01_08905, partial [Bacteroidales bacterium]|nr:hypothetical protein [Bacteroidales bacterium]
MTLIANPIYDVVFKYLMENNKVAKLLLSDLTGLNIVSLELQPQEYTARPETASVIIYRMDFKAKVRDKQGNKKLVLIEIQKAKFFTDIIRFRKYLGEQYAHPSNVIEKGNKKVGIPIITIYFIGYKLDSNIEVPIIRVARQILDNTTKEVLDVK